MEDSAEKKIETLEAKLNAMTDDRDRWQKRCEFAMKQRDELQHTVTEMIMERIREAEAQAA